MLICINKRERLFVDPSVIISIELAKVLFPEGLASNDPYILTEEFKSRNLSKIVPIDCEGVGMIIKWRDGVSCSYFKTAEEALAEQNKILFSVNGTII